MGRAESLVADATESKEDKGILPSTEHGYSSDRLKPCQ
jgi:hypothetical protein